MRCILCQNFSFALICIHCQKNYLSQNRSTRILENDFKVHSFYKYSDIENLLKTKHTVTGAAIYKILAHNSYAQFAKAFDFPEIIYAIAIDDHVKHGYAHTAILTKALKSQCIQPVYKALRAANFVTYAGKSLEYRLKNPRGFRYTFKKNIYAVIVDDIVTTGTTIKEAVSTLKSQDVTPLFALTLADAREK